jgi:hypothetical protein
MRYNPFGIGRAKPQHAESGPGQGRKEVEVRRRLLITAALLVLIGSIAQAGTLHPALEAQMETLQGDELISVIVHMTDQAPIADLNSQLRAERSTLQERHQRVIEALQLAAESQAPCRLARDRESAGGCAATPIDFEPRRGSFQGQSIESHRGAMSTSSSSAT